MPQGHWLSSGETQILARPEFTEMLCAGATTIVGCYPMPDALARAADAFGLRAMIGGRVMDANTAALAAGRFVHDPKPGEATADAARALMGHAATGGLSVGPPADLILLDPDAPNLRSVIDG